MKPLLTALLGACLLLSACQVGQPGTAGTLTTQPSANQSKGRAIQFIVNGPSALASGGKIVNSDISGVIAAGGGNVIAAGGGNVIAAGGGNVIAAGGGNFRVAAALDQYNLVEKAVLHLENAEGQRMTEYFQTGEQGSIELRGVPADTYLYAIARFKVNDKIYRVATPVATDAAGTVYYLDPINAMVTARVREVIKADGQAAAQVTLAKLKEVWTICNEASVEVDLEALETSKTWTDLVTFYEKLLPQIQDPAKRQVVADFMASGGN